MNAELNNWKALTIPFNNELNDALQQQHHAAQFIAMVGRHLIPQQPDDSNTNMEFIPGNDRLVGNALPNEMRVAFSLADLKVLILDQKNLIKKEINLQGKTKQKAFDELEQSLSDLGIEVTNLKNELHYEIPTHQLDKESVFSIKNENDFVENATYRHNAKIVLNEVAQLFDQKELIRVWPHHFDTGAFFTISQNEKGESTQTISIGMAIPDTMIDEPYYYLSWWSEKPIEGIKDIPALDAGKWMMPDWNGAVLKHSEILNAGSAKEQHKLVTSFFNEGIGLIMKIFNFK